MNKDCVEEVVQIIDNIIRNSKDSLEHFNLMKRTQNVISEKYLDTEIENINKRIQDFKEIKQYLLNADFKA